MVRNMTNRLNHQVRLRFSDSKYNPIAAKKLPYMIKIQAPPSSIFFPRFLMFSSKDHILNFVLSLWEILKNWKKPYDYVLFFSKD
jgi:hypothetical protein